MIYIKEKPILMSTPMVQTILDGRKIMTRRPLKQPFEIHPNGYITKRRGDERLCPYECPYGEVGDHLWVRETFFWNGINDNQKNIKNCAYRADGEIWQQVEDPEGFTNWKPSIFMPRWASRITLEIINIRVERLQEIGACDCYKEGLRTKLREYDGALDLLEQYAELWDSLNGKKYPWSSNPYVWVIEFKRI